MSQVYNPKTQTFVKQDQSGKFISSKKTPYKNVELKTAHTKHKKQKTEHIPNHNSS